jgi:hypothetical protein
MPINSLLVLRTKTGVGFVCPKCRVAGFEALGATDRGALFHLLICSRCGETLGEWESIEEREKELLDFAKRLPPNS